LHEGTSFLVEELDLENRIARLTPHESDYYSEPQKTVTIENLITLEEHSQRGGMLRYGDLLVTTQVTGYRQFHWGSREVLGNFQLDLPATQLRTTGLWFALDDEIRDRLRTVNLWNSSPNQYGKNWDRLREIVRYRDRFTCQSCGMVERGSAHHVHHKIPFRIFTSLDRANALDNLITLCPNCHQRAEQVVKVRSGLSGLGYCLTQIAPLLVMCDLFDLGSQTDPQSPLSDGQPTIVIYDQIPAGIGLSKAVFDRYQQLIRATYDLVTACPCREGCPACVGPAGENGVGGKEETLALLSYLNGVEYLHA
jgi:DEAD/DEAH box helicase domain-containing protein